LMRSGQLWRRLSLRGPRRGLRSSTSELFKAGCILGRMGR
jgi:hypothetical protein